MKNRNTNNKEKISVGNLLLREHITCLTQDFPLFRWAWPALSRGWVGLSFESGYGIVYRNMQKSAIRTQKSNHFQPAFCVMYLVYNILRRAQLRFYLSLSIYRRRQGQGGVRECRASSERCRERAQAPNWRSRQRLWSRRWLCSVGRRVLWVQR